MTAVVLASLGLLSLTVPGGHGELAEVSSPLVRQVPGGHGLVPDSCVINLPNGGTFDAAAFVPSSDCQKALQQNKNHTTYSSPKVQIYASDVHFQSSTPLTGFTADWVVPPLPAEHPKHGRSQVVYFWPGFKARKPEMGYPVLQPVLQYGERGPKWALQSWFVDAFDHKYPVVTAPAIDVEPGHRITSYMSQSADGSTWTVSGTNKDTGDDSTLHIAYSKAGATDYDYAMLVNENINVDTQCGRMPASTNVTFTNVTVNGKSTPPWTTRANCKGNPECDCGNSASVAPNGDVTLSWKTA